MLCSSLTWNANTFYKVVLQARLVSQAAVVGNSLYIIGGWDPGHKRDGGDILNDIWKLDLEIYAWEEVHPQVASSSAHTISLGMETWPCDGHECSWSAAGVGPPTNLTASGMYGR